MSAVPATHRRSAGKLMRLRDSRLVVSVPQSDALLAMDPQTGAGRVWHKTLAELAKRASLVGGGKRRIFRRPNVCLASGHRGPIDVDHPLVAVVQGTPWLDGADISSLVDARYLDQFSAATEAALRNASAEITPSEYTRRAVMKGVNLAADRVVAVPLGVDGELFTPGRHGGRALVAGATGEDRPYILFAAVASKHKNLEVVEAAVSGLARRGFPHLLVIVGSDRDAKEQQSHSRVVTLGKLGNRDLAALMAEADAFCLPSLMDSFGLPVVEAMASGCPVVVSDRGALPEVVADAGIVCPPTAEAVEDALAELLSDTALAARLSKLGRARAREFTWARTAEGWLSVLRTAAAER